MGSALISDLMTYVQPWLSTAPAIIVVMIWVWIISSQFLTKPYNDRRDNVEKESDSTQSRKSENKASPTIVIAKIPKKKPQFEKWSKESKHSFSHEWLITSLKGHTGPILDMDFSPNGKFLATCAQDDPGGSSGNSSGSEGNKENSSPAMPPLSRRQKKNTRGRNNSPTSKKKPKKTRRLSVLRQYIKLNLPEADLFQSILEYSLSPHDLFNYGYPTESKLYPGRACIFQFNPNAKEFYPRNESVYSSMIVYGNTGSFGRFVPPIRHYEESASLEKKCVRCSKSFFVTSGGEYLTQEHCVYHWGKMQQPLSGGGESLYSCCRGRYVSKGCSMGKLHVWSGLSPGRNGPFDGYVRTKPRKTPPADGNYGVYALDCEMCFTTQGLELTRITVVGADGRLVYDTYVRPESYIIDYNTRFSGVTAKDLSRKANAKSLRDVQNDLMGFVYADTVLVGHGLENDLRALRMIHSTVVDTAVVFPHYRGLPFRRSLKSLTATFLNRDIQTDSSGHDSCEDARSSLELILWKIRNDQLKESNHCP